MCIHKPMFTRAHTPSLSTMNMKHAYTVQMQLGDKGRKWHRQPRALGRVLVPGEPVSLRRSRRVCVSPAESFLKGLHVMLIT